MRATLPTSCGFSVCIGSGEVTSSSTVDILYSETSVFVLLNLRDVTSTDGSVICNVRILWKDKDVIFVIYLKATKTKHYFLCQRPSATKVGWDM
jgi:hypothetical protein